MNTHETAARAHEAAAKAHDEAAYAADEGEPQNGETGEETMADQKNTLVEVSRGVFVVTKKPHAEAKTEKRKEANRLSAIEDDLWARTMAAQEAFLDLERQANEAAEATEAAMIAAEEEERN